MFISRRNQSRFTPQFFIEKPKPTVDAPSRALVGNFSEALISQRNLKYDLRFNYRKRIELGLIFSLIVVISSFAVLRDLRTEPRQIATPEIKLQVADIPQTEQIKRPPPPPRPAMAIPTESEEVPPDVTIESTELNLAELPSPPPPPTEEEVDDSSPIFFAYDEPPEIIGGMPALLAALEYPELARKAGVEGTVVIGVLIDEKGKLLNTKVLKPHGSNVGLENAAIAALIKMKWKPASQRDKSVKVWVSVPVRFQLRDAT